MNWYYPLSGERLGRVVDLWDEGYYSYIRAVEGVDFEGGMSFANAPWLKVYVGGSYYDNMYCDNELGYRIRSTMQITSGISMELGYSESNINHVVYGTLKYQPDHIPAYSLFGGRKKETESTADFTDQLFRKVERDNTIKTETYTKVVANGLYVAQGTFVGSSTAEPSMPLSSFLSFMQSGNTTTYSIALEAGRLYSWVAVFNASASANATLTISGSGGVRVVN